MVTKVHITGGKGFLGRYAQEALGDGFEVEISDVDTLDVTDHEATAAALAASKPDVVCHLAGLTGAGASLADPRRFMEVNLNGTTNVLEACRLAEIKGFVFMSSLTVHGQSAAAVVEDSPFSPRHPYGGGKAAAELVVRTYARCYGIRSAILRPTLIAGEGQAEANAITEFTETVLRGEVIDIFGDGSHEREWLDPADVGSAVCAAVAYVANTPDLECESFVVSSGVGLSMADLARRVIAETGTGEVTFTPTTRQAFSLVTATDKARRELSWKPEVPTDEIIRRVVAATQAGALDPK